MKSRPRGRFSPPDTPGRPLLPRLRQKAAVTVGVCGRFFRMQPGGPRGGWGRVLASCWLGAGSSNPRSLEPCLGWKHSPTAVLGGFRTHQTLHASHLDKKKKVSALGARSGRVALAGAGMRHHVVPQEKTLHHPPFKKFVGYSWVSAFVTSSGTNEQPSPRYRCVPHGGVCSGKGSLC
ncbi:hypothetical protein HJG60_009590 [Phyllostomus discolor]|uniref:Uncharacterized protein n=1 Tax=Phyllostomus discolor TaxID=89673 RepID=A0A834DB02_9CHIR|nr:hypothetical protein HJG60_009590 [Phyllostomus discolor]